MGDNKTTDVLGIAPYGEAVKIATQGLVDGMGAFLGRICLPAAEEVGLLFRERVRTWRVKNTAAVTGHAEDMLEHGGAGLHAHPRLVMRIVEDGSWADDEIVQRMWGGLLASACSDDGRDESNLLFVNLLTQLTSSQVRILKHACEVSKKVLTPSGFIAFVDNLQVSFEELTQISGINDFHRLDRELDHMRSVGLLDLSGGFQSFAVARAALITPTTLATQLCARGAGFRGPPEEFFRVKPPGAPES
jgi:hypothetical protein